MRTIKLAEQLSQYLGDDESTVKSRSILIQRFTELHKLIQCDADSKTAQAVIDLLEETMTDFVYPEGLSTICWGG